jgi:hypothetical protein
LAEDDEDVFPLGVGQGDRRARRINKRGREQTCSARDLRNADRAGLARILRPEVCRLVFLP